MPAKEHAQILWGPEVESQLREIVRLAVAEDLGGGKDWTTAALVPPGMMAAAFVVPREAGTVAGLAAGTAVLKEMQYQASFVPLVEDGSAVSVGDRVARIEGPAGEILTAERPILNLVGRLSGIATMTARFVKAVAVYPVRIYDTRKTTPGFRLLEKYAVHCGGGTNHRAGLHKAVLIKDNHIAFGCTSIADRFTIDQAVRKARDYVETHAAEGAEMVIEVEADSLEQLERVLPVRPDIVLLDNMSIADLERAVALRNQVAALVELEASGGVTLDTIADIAKTGVERISVGALTHSAPNFDVGLDWSTV